MNPKTLQYIMGSSDISVTLNIHDTGQEYTEKGIAASSPFSMETVVNIKYLKITLRNILLMTLRNDIK